jgi:hypothetical protein
MAAPIVLDFDKVKIQKTPEAKTEPKKAVA